MILTLHKLLEIKLLLDETKSIILGPKLQSLLSCHNTHSSRLWLFLSIGNTATEVFSTL